MANTIELAQTGKRDFLISLEQKYQQRWSEEHLFEVSAPSPSELAGLSQAEIHERYPKWFGNFPFPYTNGSLHLGHAFTISKVEFAAGYQRMLGKRVLFPHGFHVTGLPIKAAADKIVREIDIFGSNFENFTSEVVEEEPTAAPTSAPAISAPTTTATDTVHKGVKSKVAAKSTGHKYQFQIMEATGVPRAEIHKFADPMYWLTYYPPVCMEDNQAFGTRIDWRRSFITTPANPYYDSFVRWQMNKLYKLGKVKFGERYTIYSPKDGQPCMDHDRSDGEGIGPQEYTGLKMAISKWSPAAKAEIEGKVGGREVFMVAATLRPETVYGQTNVFVGPGLKYGVFAMNEKEAYICTKRAARNMAFQGITTPRGAVDMLVEIEGSKLVGTLVRPPWSIVPEVYVIPMENVLATKGTGVVTSCPSDSPDDYQTWTDLKKKPEYYKIDPQWVATEPVPILSTPAYGDMTAVALVKQFKIQSQKDTKQLAEAKDVAYKEGFNNGTMVVGQFKGDAVQVAKPKVRKALIEANLAVAYAEPEGLVISRSTDECVVALMDQWYLDYGEEEWKSITERLVARMNTWGKETRGAFEGTLNWLNQWACARTYGLGSPLPWDPQFLVESLSDSTIYMSYYTVSQLLHENSIDGAKSGPLGITADQMTDEVWEYVLANGPWTSNNSLSKEKADALKHEFNYFYPFDMRSSGKDLVPNHLTFAAYTHAAIFPEDKWPLGMRTNGHLMLNGKKMSKSTGNSLTMRESVQKFGADATRLSLADAGDGVEDANFDEKTANANILRLFNLLEWSEEQLKVADGLRNGPKNYHDRIFEEETNDLINITQGHFEATCYKDALKFGFYDLLASRDWYREITIDTGMHGDLLRYWIRAMALLICPFAPHFAEHVWTALLGERKSVQLALWPTPSRPVDKTLIEAGAYMRNTIKTIRDAELQLIKRLTKGKKGREADATTFDPNKPKAVRVYVSTSFPEWQNACVDIVKASYDAANGKIDDVRCRALLAEKGLIQDKRAMPFIKLFPKRIAEFGVEVALRRTLPFSETDVLNELLPYLKRTLVLVDAEVLAVSDARKRVGEAGFTTSIIDASEPGVPAFEYYNVQS